MLVCVLIDLQTGTQATATPASGMMDPITAVCTLATGHEGLVPCRICTAFVPRCHLDGGLLPEETHHDEPALTQFFAFEARRRLERQQEAAQELMRPRAMPQSAGVGTSSSKKIASILRRPAAVVPSTRKYVWKKPAAAGGKHQRDVTAAKNPSRAR